MLPSKSGGIHVKDHSMPRPIKLQDTWCGTISTWSDLSQYFHHGKMFRQKFSLSRDSAELQAMKGCFQEENGRKTALYIGFSVNHMEDRELYLPFARLQFPPQDEVSNQ